MPQAEQSCLHSLIFGPSDFGFLDFSVPWTYVKNTGMSGSLFRLQTVIDGTGTTYTAASVSQLVFEESQ